MTTFTIPNEADAGFPDQAEPDSRDFGDILAASLNLTGVVSGCGVTAQGTPDMTVAVASGVAVVAGTSATVTSGNVTITAADATNPRFDLICIASDGTKSAVAGTAASNPVFPDPAGKAVIAAVYVPANDTDIDANQIIDKRVLVKPWVQLAGDAMTGELRLPSVTINGAQASTPKKLHLVGDIAVEYGNGASFVERAGSGIILTRNDSATPTTILPYIHCIVQGKGDNTNPVGVSCAYFQARDRSDVTGSNKGFLYGAQFSVVPTVARDTVLVDDVACIVAQNDAATALKATDCIYIGHNGVFTAGAAEWITAYMADCNADYTFRCSGTYVNGLRLDEATFTGLAIKIGQGDKIGSRNNANGADIDLLELNASDDLKFMSGGQDIAVWGATASATNANGRVMHLQSAAAANIPELKIENSATSGKAEAYLLGKTGADVVVGLRLFADSAGSAYMGTSTAHGFGIIISNTEVARWNGSGHLGISEGKSVILGTTTGTMIGTAAAQKLGFWNATPIVQPGSAGGLGAITVTNYTGGARSFNRASYTMDQLADMVCQLHLSIKTMGLVA